MVLSQQMRERQILKLNWFSRREMKCVQVKHSLDEISHRTICAVLCVSYLELLCWRFNEGSFILKVTPALATTRAGRLGS